jgi:Zn-dependent protease with chaperone function
MQAWLYTTQSSLKTAVTLRFEETKLFIDGDDGITSYDLEELTFSARLGNMPRSIYLPDKRVCETQNNDAIDAVLKRLGRDRTGHWLHFFESKLRYLFAALIVTAGFSYLFVTYGLPALAKEVALNIPASLVYRIDLSTLSTLDKLLLQPSNLSQERQDALKEYFLKHVNTEQEWPKIKPLFRSGEVGANAFALPDGTIVFTDDLVALAKDDKELLSIFFHELGHVQKRHALRSVLQDASFYLLLTAITGDVTAAGNALATLPTILVESSYSRNMELEADDYAYELTSQFNIEHKHFANIMTRLMEQTHESNSTYTQYLSSHPLTELRIERFQK